MICQKFIQNHLPTNQKLKLLLKPLNALGTYLPRRSCSYQHKCFPGVPYPPKDPPLNYNPTELNTDCFSAPENVQLLVFRPLTKGEVLGPKASKRKKYKNPEYYAYHRYSFVDLQKNALRIKMENYMKELCPNLVGSSEVDECECKKEENDMSQRCRTKESGNEDEG